MRMFLRQANPLRVLRRATAHGHFEDAIKGQKMMGASEAARAERIARRNAKDEARSIADELERGKITLQEAKTKYETLFPGRKISPAAQATETEAEQIARESRDEINDIQRETRESIARANASHDVKVAEAKAKTAASRVEREGQRELQKLEKQWAKEDQNWFQRHKILTGLGALGAGGLAYNIAGPSGTPIPQGGMSPEESGAQRAMMDAMNAGYGMPMPQVQAANSNYMGTVEPDLARGASPA